MKKQILATIIAGLLAISITGCDALKNELSNAKNELSNAKDEIADAMNEAMSDVSDSFNGFNNDSISETEAEIENSDTETEVETEAEMEISDTETEVETEAEIENSDTETEVETEAEMENSDTETVAAIDPEFKAAMDGYEKIMNSYCDFMVKFNESPTDMTMLTEYMSMLEDYSEAMDMIDSIDSDSLNDAEYAYYLEVITRINNKLISIM